MVTKDTLIGKFFAMGGALSPAQFIGLLRELEVKVRVDLDRLEGDLVALQALRAMPAEQIETGIARLADAPQGASKAGFPAFLLTRAVRTGKATSAYAALMAASWDTQLAIAKGLLAS